MQLAQRPTLKNTQKQIIQIQHKRIKNPNWQELSIYKRGRGFELGTTENKSSKWPERDFEPGTTGLQVRRADPSATLPPLKETSWIAPCLLEVSDAWISSIFVTLVYGDSRVILSNQKTGFTRLAETWFVVRPNWTCVVNSNITFHLVFNCSCVSKKRCTFLLPVLL